MSLTQWGAALVGCATLLLTACTVVDLDEKRQPHHPGRPTGQSQFRQSNTRADRATNRQSRVLDAAKQHALDASALSARLKTPSPTAESVFVRLTSQIENVDTTNAREKSIVMRVNDALSPSK